ncbi:right-handed parallel beta-helix repeat-containing protein [Synechococcus sp. CS-1328]|uniref:right-handed parallel beta-helix repeat-containing protein n=1 Tax=Synechococcus sp. CS-1328 TaxID=2847976 RepID=UPI00223BF4B7|nr:right-handed parallel beta-helix repeat-containing protein [Synechococcus sp. CS-1328]MCT0224324.1 right-handed parallel beta-helix repeat-containing protein [Synechococcus sp. CS-1328]
MDFVVSNLNDAGLGSLRWALEQANSTAGFDSISCDQNLSGGRIALASALPDILDGVAIKGLSSPTGAPLVQIDFNANAGLIFRGGSARSSLTGFSLVDAGSDALRLEASAITIASNYIGVDLDGITGIANRGHGIRIGNASSDNLIGTLEPLTGIALADQVSNVISANTGNGILIEGSRDNQIVNNRIGTNAGGTSDLGNKGTGIQITAQANNNRIGGDASGGNSPTNGVFVRPPQGNLLSGNSGDGLRIDSDSRGNLLMGNFIGTDSAGTTAIGNDGDGVAILNANDNKLIGTTFSQDPFVFFNVLGGNGGNGLRVNSSNDTTIHANFFGLGSDNATIVANGGNGALIEGSSSNTQYGGVIPLGNVNAGNRGNGIEVRDRASDFISFNTFAGLTAFGGIAPNQGDGMLITSRGRNNTIRTNVISGNLLNGLHISGRARGVSVDPNIIGLSTNGLMATYTDSSGAQTSWGNGLDGIRIDGSAKDITIAGNRRSVIPRNTVANNPGYGIAIQDQAKRVLVSNTSVGLSSTEKETFPNGEGGIYVGPSNRKVVIGSQKRRLINQVVGNIGDGIMLDGTRKATVYFNQLNQNRGSGLRLQGGDGNRIVHNQASDNGRYGFELVRSPDNTLRGNRGSGNRLGLYS